MRNQNRVKWAKKQKAKRQPRPLGGRSPKILKGPPLIIKGAPRLRLSDCLKQVFGKDFLERCLFWGLTLGKTNSFRQLVKYYHNGICMKSIYKKK